MTEDRMRVETAPQAAKSGGRSDRITAPVIPLRQWLGIEFLPGV